MSSVPDSDDADEATAITSETVVGQAGYQSMLTELRRVTGTDFARSESRYRTFMTGVESGVQESKFFDALLDIHAKLSSERIVGSISSVEAWANGEQSFRIVPKTWPSVIDKLYRINIEENAQYSQPPLVPTIMESAQKKPASMQRWITPECAHEVADDLIRTKFVVPFADGVVDVSERISAATNECGLPRFIRFHAKDSGYHARHHYILIPVPGYDGQETTVALEVKVLTKAQDTLGELTHLLYEKKRTGQLESVAKRKLAWQFESPDFLASYIGHAGHFVESSIVDLKNRLLGLKGYENGQS
ncbi:hypothetical protein MO973_09575 [Paenibacillus sp. TRM 82003]|uniref:hypothetical protein n=1 Tax=Kineococcus sp. TRM81007 TaxID=2925831 RepID=UPI001F5A940F|nr:hypothetical protein [Kineococcus sp. TRM81007]MCI2238097.1 hypothetical protein [Kineococcus sp. TRM81007]MCI3920482.1 hypothetical protein [Paenibacillus sp. TRM 82003]